jgi:hypothetical protein
LTKARELWALAAFSVTLRNEGAFIDPVAISTPVKQQTRDLLRAVDEGVACGVFIEEVPGAEGPRRIKFAHHRYQEYLAGWLLANHPKSAVALVSTGTPFWTNRAGRKQFLISPAVPPPIIRRSRRWLAGRAQAH